MQYFTVAHGSRFRYARVETISNDNGFLVGIVSDCIEDTILEDVIHTKNALYRSRPRRMSQTEYIALILHPLSRRQLEGRPSGEASYKENNLLET